ncbi:MAG: hypothetical protein GDA36_12995 [Rhodobacteraceae bacterium]|nr:hypothetical protein [Paracoccaceae bacterium]
MKLRFGHSARSDDLTSGKAVLVVWFYAIVGVCRLKVILFVLPDCRHCPLGVLFWPARII